MLLDRFSLRNRTQLLAHYIHASIAKIRLLRPAGYQSFEENEQQGVIVLLEFEGHPPLAFRSLVEKRTLMVQRHSDRDYYWDQFRYFVNVHEKVIGVGANKMGGQAAGGIMNIQFLFSQHRPYSPTQPKGLQFELENGHSIRLSLEFGRMPVEVLLQFGSPEKPLDLEGHWVESLLPNAQETSDRPFDHGLSKFPVEGKYAIYQPDIHYFKRKIIPLPQDPVPSYLALETLRKIRNAVWDRQMDLVDIQLGEQPEGGLFLIPPLEWAEGPPFFALDWLDYLIMKIEEQS